MKTLLRKKLIKQWLISFLTIIFLIPKITLAAQEFPENKYPRLANYFLKWDITDEEAKELAKWDLLILSPQVVIQNKNILKIIKTENPRIKILAYVLSEEIPISSATMDYKYFWRDIYETVNNNNWWLKDNTGNHVVFWPGHWMINITNEIPSASGQRWSDFFSEFIYQKILPSGAWDGIFFDNSFDDISWINNGNIDINNDGQTDSREYINRKWQEGMNKLFVQTRNLLGPDKIIVVNSSDFYNQYLNGRMYENFSRSAGDWQNIIGLYINKNNGYQPFTSIINSNTKNSGDRNDFKEFRYGLTSTLLGDGFYSFDQGDQTHHEIWWYDEYDIFLGKPVSSARNLTSKSNQIKEGVWQREFQNGIVLINSSSEAKSIDLGAEFEKLRGSQDITTNDGSIVTSLDLNPNDGLILLRPIEKITGQVFTNASFVRVLNSQGQSIRNGFFAYLSLFRGNTNIIIKDLENNGDLETVITEGNRVEIYNSSNQLKYRFFPYGEKFNGGINLALSDLNNDGFQEIITGAAKGGPHIRIFNSQGRLINPGFFAYEKNFRGGVSLAVGDIDGDGRKEIITGAGQGGGPLIKIFDKEGRLINPGFFAYEKNFRGGVSLAVGDIDGDGQDEIITGKGFGGEPLVKIFNNHGKLINQGFFAFDKSNRNGVRVIAYDLDGNGKVEILAASSNVFTTALINK